MIFQKIDDKIKRGPAAPRLKAAVFDVNHGAVSLAGKYRSSGFDTIAFDVYEKMPEDKRNALSESSGIRISVSTDDLKDVDVVFSPVHLTPLNRFLKAAHDLGIPVLTHHEAVGLLLKNDERLKNRCLIEITGVRGKTTTAALSARMISALGKTVLHTSRGIEIFDRSDDGHVSETLLRAGGTISPSHLPEIIDEILNAGIDPSFMIFEISLGCTGAADISMITTLEPSYGIAGNSACSTSAKTSFLKRYSENESGYVRPGRPAGILIADENDRNTISEILRKCHDRSAGDVIYYGRRTEDPVRSESLPAHPGSVSGRPGDISGMPDVLLTARGNDEIRIDHPEKGQSFSCRLHHDLFMNAYLPSFAGASALAFATGVSGTDIVAVIEAFCGIEGRMKELSVSGRYVLDNSNSGLNEASARAAIVHVLRKYGEDRKQYPESFPDPGSASEHSTSGNIILVIGENAREVCEGFPPETVEKIVRDYCGQISGFILVGARMKEASERLKASGISVRTAENRESGEKTAFRLSGKNDIIISAVKCFR